MQIIAAMRREIISHIQIQHTNILPIIGIVSSDTHPLSIVVPLAVNGDALEYLSNLDGPLRAAAVLNIIQNVAYALEYLHYMVPPIIHGDLHARNILVDAQGNALLCDFGLSRIKHEQTRSATNIVEGGRYRYLAPELLSPSAEYKFRTTPASDCYSFAMTILQLVTLEKPFAEYKYESGAFHAAERGLRPQHPPLEAFGTLSELIVDLLWTLLTYMWDHEENKRPGMDTVAYRVGELRSLDIQNYF
ncbi:kinase-like protein [Clavulina sp. PMI_390]|nr:kinase-like protein [Clavulina sp. PMI_390]